jgi:hypothetical protein
MKRKLFEIEAYAYKFAAMVNGSVKRVSLPGYNFVDDVYIVTYQ